MKGQDLGRMGDEELLEYCVKWGVRALEARRRFLGALPEIERRGLWKKEGFTSIFHFAAVKAGVSRDQVTLSLNLERRFADKPALHQLLVNGEASIHKLTRVASVATPETDAEWAEQVRQLPKTGLETLVRDVRVGEDQPKTRLPGQTLELDDDVRERLSDLAAKGIDINELLRETLDRQEIEIKEEKEKIGEDLGEASSRYIPAKVRKLVEKEFGTVCAVDSCDREAVQLHHTGRFSITKRHDPRFLAPLCKGHHQVAHTIDVRARARWRPR